MVPFKKIQDSVSGDLERLNRIISDTLKSRSPLMQQVVDNFLASKGKQLRPILVILSGRMFNGGEAVSDSVIYAGAAIELLHNASLIHDDVIDESQQRRGRPSINRIWDNHIAVLVGDFFVSGALYCAEKTHQLNIISVMAHLGRELSLGEIEQIDNARNHSIDEETYLGIIKRKTASLFSSCVQVALYRYVTNRKPLAFPQMIATTAYLDPTFMLPVGKGHLRDGKRIKARVTRALIGAEE